MAKPVEPQWAILCALIVSLLLPSMSHAQPVIDPQPVSHGSKVFEQVKPALLQIRVNLNTGKSLSVIGSGFLVSPDGLVVTNYHVVSSVVMKPDIYSLEYLKSDGSTGPLQIMALDVRNDLALLRLKGKGLPTLSFQKTPLSKGDRGYALGNPLGIGMAIAEGTYNGLVSNQYNDQFHFTGALNSGMSGGPTVTEKGTVFGVNRAIVTGGQMVSYVVPVHHVSALLEKAAKIAPKPHSQLLSEVNTQLLAYQDELAKKLLEKPFATRTVGRGYYAPYDLADFFDCSGYQAKTPSAKIAYSGTTCTGNSALSAGEKMSIGNITFEQTLYTGDMGTSNFYKFYSFMFSPRSDVDGLTRREVSRYACKEDLLASGNSRMRVVLCERQYREFDGLYDIQIKIATLNESKTGLNSNATFSGFGHENGMSLAKRYLEGISWKP